MQRVPGWRDGTETLRRTSLSERESEPIQHFAPLNLQENDKTLRLPRVTVTSAARQVNMPSQYSADVNNLEELFT
jgi:hypothetical protein